MDGGRTGKIHFKSFVRDIREMLGDVQEVYDAIEKEKELARPLAVNWLLFNWFLNSYFQG